MGTIEDISKGIEIAESIASLFSEVAAAVSGEKEERHGDKLVGHQTIANGWNWWLGAKYGIPPVIRPSDAAQMLTIMKQARATGGTFNEDDGFDQTGYSGIYAGLVQVEQSGQAGYFSPPDRVVERQDTASEVPGPPVQVVKRHTRGGKSIKGHARRKPAVKKARR